MILPRIYTMDRVVTVSSGEQLKKLISEDLRKAVYVSDFDRANTQIGNASLNNTPQSHFVKLQKINKIEK